MQNIDFSFAQDPNTLSLAIVYGFLPAIIWVFYWIRENKESHSRRSGLLTTLFFLGALVVIATLPVQKFMLHLSGDINVLNVLWAGSEELLKFAIFAFVVLLNSSKNIVDPIDYPVYIMVAALGFAGFENALYFLGPLQTGNTGSLLLSGSMRYLGTTLLHAACSCLIGISLGFAYFKSKGTSILYGIFGIAVAITAHSAFNYFIVQNNEANFLQIFCALWIAAIIIIFLLEVLRRMGSIESRSKKEHAFFAHIEELFQQVLGFSGQTIAHAGPISEALVAKGFKPESTEYKKFTTLLRSLRALYSAYLINEGSEPKTVDAVSVTMVPDNVSPKTAFGAISMMKGEIEHEMEAKKNPLKKVDANLPPAQATQAELIAKEIAAIPAVTQATPVPEKTAVPVPVVPPASTPIVVAPAPKVSVPIVPPIPKPIDVPPLTSIVKPASPTPVPVAPVSHLATVLSSNITLAKPGTTIPIEVAPEKPKNALMNSDPFASAFDAQSKAWAEVASMPEPKKNETAPASPSIISQTKV